MLKKEKESYSRLKKAGQKYMKALEAVNKLCGNYPYDKASPHHLPKTYKAFKRIYAG